jgi:hypothetical protein
MEEMEEKERMEQKGLGSQVRKPFHRPSLRVYGNISTITKHGGGTGGDHAGHSRTGG